MGDLVSEICSPAGCVVKISRYGVTNLDKNASIVEIGATGVMPCNFALPTPLSRLKQSFASTRDRFMSSNLFFSTLMERIQELTYCPVALSIVFTHPL